MVLILNLGLSECSGTGNRPVDWLFATVNEALLDKIGKSFQFGRFVFGMNGPVFVCPVSCHAETFKLLALYNTVFVSKFGAGLAHFQRRVIGAPRVL